MSQRKPAMIQKPRTRNLEPLQTAHREIRQEVLMTKKCKKLQDDSMEPRPGCLLKAPIEAHRAPRSGDTVNAASVNRSLSFRFDLGGRHAECAIQRAESKQAMTKNSKLYKMDHQRSFKEDGHQGCEVCRILCHKPSEMPRAHKKNKSSKLKTPISSASPKKSIPAKSHLYIGSQLREDANLVGNASGQIIITFVQTLPLPDQIEAVHWKPKHACNLS